MAHGIFTPGSGKPSNYHNLSPFAGSRKESGKSGQGLLAIGYIAVLAWIALILCTLIMKA
jgi:hypothetical protein